MAANIFITKICSEDDFNQIKQVYEKLKAEYSDKGRE